MTAYRQQALACAAWLAGGPRRTSELRALVPDAPVFSCATGMGGSPESSGASICSPQKAPSHSPGGHQCRSARGAIQCPLRCEKEKWRTFRGKSAFDPKRTFIAGGIDYCIAYVVVVPSFLMA
jgi:hypothetical protein